MTEAPYPKRGGKGRPPPLPTTMDGIRVQTVAPYGGLTYEEWIATPLKPSQFQMHKPSGHWKNPEQVGEEILRVVKEKKLSASEAADLVIT